MSDKSLFAVLLRSPWWVSFVLVGVVALLAGALLPEAYVGAGMLGGFPFFVIGCTALWRQRHLPSAAFSQEVLHSLSGMGWRDLEALLHTAFGRQGYQVTLLPGPGADMQLHKNGVMTLVSAKRWKAATLGIEPLRELVAAREQHQAANSVCITLGQVSAKALEFAAQNRITLVSNTDLVQLVAGAYRNMSDNPS